MYANKSDLVTDRREMLKVKIKSLAEEARIIRAEEHKQLAHRRRLREREGSTLDSTPGTLYIELREHRRTVVRSAARFTHLAYGFIRGLTLEQMEGPKAHLTKWQAEQVRAMLKKYGPKGFIEPECMSTNK